jgi:hypothetical protein
MNIETNLPMTLPQQLESVPILFTDPDGFSE